MRFLLIKYSCVYYVYIVFFCFVVFVGFDEFVGFVGLVGCNMQSFSDILYAPTASCYVPRRRRALLF